MRSGPGLVWARANHQLAEAGTGDIQFATEIMLRQQSQQDLGGGAHDAAGRDVATKHTALRIRYGDVEVGAVRGGRAGQA